MLLKIVHEGLACETQFLRLYRPANEIASRVDHGTLMNGCRRPGLDFQIKSTESDLLRRWNINVLDQAFLQCSRAQVLATIEQDAKAFRSEPSDSVSRCRVTSSKSSGVVRGEANVSQGILVGKMREVAGRGEARVMCRRQWRAEEESEALPRRAVRPTRTASRNDRWPSLQCRGLAPT